MPDAPTAASTPVPSIPSGRNLESITVLPPMVETPPEGVIFLMVLARSATKTFPVASTAITCGPENRAVLADPSNTPELPGHARDSS